MLLMFLMPVLSFAERVEYCDWIWSTDVTTANDDPDYLYCDRHNTGTFKSETVGSYIQNTIGAYQVTVQVNTTWNNSLKIHGITPCSNTAATGDMNYKGCIRGDCDIGTTTLAWYQLDNVADNIKYTKEVTPIGDGFRLSVDGDTATCWTVRTMVYWK